MAYLSLYRKYRPQTFGEILGQEHVSSTLSNAVDEGRVAHAYLFSGPRGTGKTSTARILAKALNCAEGPTSKPCGKCESCVAIVEGSSLDVFEMDAASHSGVDDTRDILAGVSLATAGARKKVYVIDEVHMLTVQSFNALLKTLEEPPPHVVFILATTEAHKVLPTIVGRTQRFDFRRVPAEIIERHLAEVAKLENIDIDPEALEVVARHAEGSVRDALSALDQMSSLAGHVSLSDAQMMLGHRRQEALADLFDAVGGGDLAGVFRSIHSFVAQGADIRQLSDEVLDHVRSLLLLKTAPDAEELLDAPAEDRPRLRVQAESFTTASLLRALDLVGAAIIEMRNAPDHRHLLEVALVRATSPETDAAPAGLLRRIERLERRLGIEGADEPPAATPPIAEPRSQRPPRRARAQRAPGAAPEKEPIAAAESAAPEKPSEVAAETPSPAAPPVPATVGFSQIKDAWSATLQEVNRRSRRVGAYLNPSRPVELKDDVLSIEVQASFHAEAMSKKEHVSHLEDSLHATLGIRPTLSFHARGEDPEPAAAIASEQVADLHEAEPVAAEHDPVELVKKGLGAEVVEERGAK